MDITLTVTFLEVVAAGSLVKAATRLNVTQAAVSARLSTLETTLEKRLFIRNRGGARLTAAGRAFLPYATQLAQVWERARANVALRPGCEAVLAVGGEVSLWSAVLLDWLLALRSDRPAVAVRTEVDTAERLLERVQNGTLDMAILYSPLRRPGVESSLLLEEELIAVSNRPNQVQLDLADYIYVDWGPDFCAQHDAAFPELRNASLAVNFGPLALRFMLKLGGTGYFRTRAVERHLANGSLHRVAAAPPFSYSLYAAYATQADPALIAWARDQLRAATESGFDGWA